MNLYPVNVTLDAGILRSLLPVGSVLQLRLITSPAPDLRTEDTISVPVVDAARCCLRPDAATANTVQICEMCMIPVLDLHMIESFQSSRPIVQPAAAALHDLTMGW